jgi:hypothetical protein
MKNLKSSVETEANKFIYALIQIFIKAVIGGIMAITFASGLSTNSQLTPNQAKVNI